MISVRFGIISLVLLVLVSCQPKDALTPSLAFKATKVAMGDSTVYLISGMQMKGDVLLLNVHENEQTALNVMIDFGLKDSIPFLFLHQNQQRRIFFRLKDTIHSVDPNRIFTTPGIQKTLADSMFYTKDGENAVYSFGRLLLNSLEGRKWIITLHNNTQDNYSVLSYGAGGEEEMNAKEIIVVESEDPDDFILTTDSGLFNELKNAGVNVVLQSANPVDDGSLSVYCAEKNLPYVNVEAEHGHVVKQKQMLDLVLKSIKKPILGEAN